jgi:hypothetical protein
MSDAHVYYGPDGKEKGLWRRVFVNPNLSSDTNVDPFSQKSFLNSTINKNDTYGNLFDRSKEASEIRASKNGGKDPIKEKYYENYSKKRNGKLHPAQQKEKFKQAIKKANDAGINVEI